VRKFGCGILGQYNYDAYITIHEDILTAKTQTEKETVREMGSKDGKKQN
jgi:hypothetical protein